MKMFITVLVVITLLLTVLVGCGQSDDEEIETAREVNILALVSLLGDAGYNDGIVWELMSEAERLNNAGNVKITTDIVEIEVGSDNVRESIDYAFRTHRDLVIAIDHNLLQFLGPAAASFPDMRIILLDMESAAPNMLSMLFKPSEAAFLCGALSALMSEGGIIGTVIGQDIFAVNDFVVGYIEGALYVNPDIQVLVDIIGNFHDVQRASDLAEQQIERGVDVIFGVAGGASLGVIETAYANGIFAIGVDLDQTEHVEEHLRNTIITSCLKRFDVLIPSFIGEFLNDSLVFGEVRRYGLADSAVGITRNEIYRLIVPQEVQDKIDELEEAIITGEISVQSALLMTRRQYENLLASVS